MKGFYPEETKPFWLSMHASLPAGKRPTFYARFITKRQRREIAELVKASYAAEDANDEAKADELMGKALSMLIARAEHVPAGFEVSKAGDFLDVHECAELYEKAHEAITLTRDELKKSASPSGSDSSISATSADGDGK